MESIYNGITGNLRGIYKTMSPEKIILMWGSFIVAFLLMFSAAIMFNSRFLIAVPALGGTLEEGILGTPRFINPVLASSQQDIELTSLIYAGLTKKDKDGNFINDIAQEVTQSADGLSYHVLIKPTARFHNGTHVTADDIIYTVSMVQNPRIKSPQAFGWEGVSVQKISDTELSFTLKRPYPLFMESLSLGIMPRMIWKDLSDEQFSLSDYNIHAIGAGPFEIDSISTKSGIPQVFTLTSHKYYTLGRPYLDSIVIHTYPTEKALVTAFNDKEVTRISSISPSSLATIDVKNVATLSARLPRVFTIFLNPNKAEFLSDKNVRKALSLAIDRNAIIDSVYKNNAVALSIPYPFDLSTTTENYDLTQAQKLLAGSKYVKQLKASSTLEIDLITTNNEEMKAVADKIKSAWEPLGVSTHILVYETADINQNIIKDRDFQALLYGSFVSHPSDLYAFWHSSQRNYPGVNISSYVSNTLDRSLTILRESIDTNQRAEAYQDALKEFEEETPGIFLFSPTLIYAVQDTITTDIPPTMEDASGRFELVHTWYKNKQYIWPKTYNKALITTLENIIH
jgi:peptide/nickel transport system substrate-binding protein